MKRKNPAQAQPGIASAKARMAVSGIVVGRFGGQGQRPQAASVRVETTIDRSTRELLPRVAQRFFRGWFLAPAL